MTGYRVIYSPEADEHLADLYRYLSVEASPQTARAYVARVMDICQTLSLYPHRGIPRSDLRPGLRLLAYRRRVVIAYFVSGDRIDIVGIFGGGRDYAAVFED